MNLSLIPWWDVVSRDIEEEKSWLIGGVENRLDTAVWTSVHDDERETQWNTNVWNWLKILI